MLHFEVQRKLGQRADYGASVESPRQLPSFVLVFNDDWNDFTYRTWFALFFFDENGQRHFVGELKLLKRDTLNTFEVLPQSWDGNLDKNFCSLGIESSYYSRIYDMFRETRVIDDLLTCLRDCAYNQNIYEDFIEDDGFKTSLLREDSSEQAVVEATFMLSGKDKAAAYSFGLHFAPIIWVVLIQTGMSVCYTTLPHL